jgi:uracil-DNA glycosylase family 4
MPAPLDCQGCPLAKHRLKVVNGNGPANARIVAVGEAPGEQEDKQGRGFVGESGQILRGYMKQIGIDPEQVYWLNCCRCRPLGNRKPTAKEIMACLPYLIDDIRRINPNLILTLGGPALCTLWQKANITQVRGSILQNPDTGIKLLAAYHPMAISHEWGREPEMLADLAKAKVESASPDIPDDHTEVVFLTTIEEVQWFRDWLFELAPTLESLSIDCETTGLSYLNDEILSISFTPVRGRDFWGVGYAMPLLQKGAADYWGDDLQQVLNLLQEIFGGPFSFAGQNFKFDQKFIERAHGETSGLSPDVRTAFGFRFRRIDRDRTALDFDTMLGFHLLHEEKPHSLEYQRSLFTTMSYYEAEVRDQTANKIHMAEADNEVLWQYNASDTDCTGRLAVVHKEAIDREPKLRWLLDNISLPLHDFCRRMELRGALIDRERFDALCADYGRRIVDAEARLLQYHPPFNYRSDTQLRQVLFKDLKLPRVDVKTKGAKACEACQMGFCEDHDGTGAEALEAIREKMRSQKKTPHPILDVLQELSSLTKLKGTYLDGSGGQKKGMLPHIARDGRIHTDYRIDGTDTGRLSTSPNLQNIPKPDKDPEFRKLFIAPPGCVFLEADWSQLELRILAYVAGDKSLIAMLESGVDVHTSMARKIWPDVDPDLDDATWEKLHKDLRDRTKGFNFGVGYGITAHTVAKRFGMTIAAAEKMIGMYLRILPSLPVYFHDRRRELILTGGGETVLGRRRRIAGLQTFRNSMTYKKQIGHIQRQLYNFPIQSPGSDIHSLGSIRLDTDDWLLEDLPVPGGTHPRACCIQSVHDSVGMEAVARDVDDPALLETARYIKATMEEIPQTLLGWKLPVELKWGPSWGEPMRQLDKEENIKDLTAKAS